MLFIMLDLADSCNCKASRARCWCSSPRRSAWPVAGALLLLNRPFGFVALLGVIALMGIVMRNSVILIDQIEQDAQPRRRHLESDRRGGRAALPADRAHCSSRGVGDDSAVAQRVLGSDGSGDHGRPHRRHRSTLLSLPAMYAAWFRVKAAGASGQAGDRALSGPCVSRVLAKRAAARSGPPERGWRNW